MKPLLLIALLMLVAPSLPAAEPDASATDAQQAVSEVTALLERAQHDSRDRAGLHPQAAARIEAALPGALAAGEHRAAAELLRLRWLMRFQQNRLEGSASDLLAALQQLDQAGASEAERGAVLANLSYTYVLAGDFERGIRYARRNLVTSLAGGDPDAYSVDAYIIGDAYLKTGEMDLARRYFEQALAPYRDRRDRDYFEAVTKLATIRRETGDAEGAAEIHREVVSFFSTSGNYREVPARIELALDELALGHMAEARAQATRALQDPRAFTEQRIDALLALLRIERAEGLVVEASQRSAEIGAQFDTAARDTDSPFIYPLRRLRWARETVALHLAAGDREAALQQGELGLATYRHVRGRLDAGGASPLAWTAAASPFIETYLAALYAFDRGRIAEVLETTYSSALLAPDGGAPGRAARAAQRFEDYLAAEKAVVDRLSEHDDEPGPDRLAALDRARVQRDLARERYLLGEATTAETAPGPAASGALPAIPPGDVFLRYHVGQAVSFVLVRDHRGERYHELPPRAEVEALVRRARGDLQVVGAEPETGALADLSRLLPPDLAALGVERVVVVTDDVTHGLPFAAINVNPQRRPYRPLGETREVVRTLSLRGYYGAEPPAVAPTGETPRPRIVIFADPAFGAGDAGGVAAFRNWSQQLQRLPWTAREAESIAGFYPPESVSTYLGRAATSDVLLDRPAREAAVLHIATHGYYHPDNPDIVGIATAAVDAQGREQRGFMSLSELLSEPLNTDLVVISGCETLLGRPFGGLGVRSLAQGLIAQGAGAVMGSLWKVPDRPSAEFMRLFYAALAEEAGDASRALLYARQKLREQPRYASPATWAAFELTSTRRATERNVFGTRAGAPAASP